MSITLRQRKNADGTTSFRLDIFYNGKRTIETLKNVKLTPGLTAAEKALNKQNLALAEKVAAARKVELESSTYCIATDAGKKVLVVPWMKAYSETYTKKDKRNITGAIAKFEAFLLQEGHKNLTFYQLDDILMEDFQEYLIERQTGEGASSYFSRFKKMVKQAFRKKLMPTNPGDLVPTKQGKAKKKQVLTIDEIKLLANTPTNATEVRRAFLFCCLTGLRWCDVKVLKWSDIDLRNKLLTIIQNKTGEELTNPLNDTAIKLLGEPAEGLVFTLPTSDGANSSLKDWVKRAGITKQITWHNGRHSFGTNLILNEVDVLTASKMLKHTSLKHTHRYVDTAKELKERASNRLNIDFA